jgi:hypothetical protein
MIVTGCILGPLYAGCGSGLVTGGALSGDLLGGGGTTGSEVGDTGSSSGTTV